MSATNWLQVWYLLFTAETLANIISGFETTVWSNQHYVVTLWLSRRSLEVISTFLADVLFDFGEKVSIIYNKLFLRAIFTYPTQHFSTRVPIASQLHEEVNKLWPDLAKWPVSCICIILGTAQISHFSTDTPILRFCHFQAVKTLFYRILQEQFDNYADKLLNIDLCCIRGQINCLSLAHFHPSLRLLLRKIPACNTLPETAKFAHS